MKIVIIRHATVNMKWEKKYDSKTYDMACEKYDTSDIIPITKKIFNENNISMIYTSQLSRSYETANRLFDKKEFYKTALINEVPLKSFKDTRKKYKLWMWNFIGRLQWLFNNRRQPETKSETIFRASKAIQLVENNNQDCFIITHGFYMRTFIRELKSQGYKIEKQSRIGIANLDKIIAIK